RPQGTSGGGKVTRGFGRGARRLIRSTNILTGRRNMCAVSDASTETDGGVESGAGTPAGADDPRAAFPARTVAPDDYEVIGELAHGGMGRILRAWDRRHDRPVAIKVLLVTTDAAARRFGREARLTARLQHPSIVSLYEMGRWSNGEPFFAMKLVEGCSLAEAAAQATTRNARLALLPHLIAATEALAYAH